MQSNKDIPVFILAGGLGTRISEETHLKPKPMIEVGEVPVLVHLMRWYYSFGFNDFVICAGYRSWEIKNYFLNYEFRRRDLQVDHRQSVNAPPTRLRCHSAKIARKKNGEFASLTPAWNARPAGG